MKIKYKVIYKDRETDERFETILKLDDLNFEEEAKEYIDTEKYKIDIIVSNY